MDKTNADLESCVAYKNKDVKPFLIPVALLLQRENITAIKCKVNILSFLTNHSFTISSRNNISINVTLSVL